MRNTVMFAIRDAQGLSSTEKLMLMTIESRNGDKGEGYFRTNEGLQQDLGMKRSQTLAVKGELVKKNLIKSIFRGSNKASVLYVNIDELEKYIPAAAEGSDNQTVPSDNQTGGSENWTVGSDNQDHKDNNKNNLIKSNSKSNYTDNRELEEENTLSEKTGVITLPNCEKPSTLLTSSNREGQRNVAIIEETIKEEEQNQTQAADHSQYETDERLERGPWYRKYLLANPRPTKRFERSEWTDKMEEAWCQYSGEARASDEW